MLKNLILNNTSENYLKKLYFLSKKKWFFWIVAIFFCLYFLLGSLSQGRYVYDGFHWGLLASNANDLLNGKLPYKDFFVHYGILTLVFQSIALKI